MVADDPLIRYALEAEVRTLGCHVFGCRGRDVATALGIAAFQILVVHDGQRTRDAILGAFRAEVGPLEKLDLFGDAADVLVARSA